MPVTATHQLFDKFEPQWKRLRDAFDGQDAVKAKGRREGYIFRLEGQKDDFEDDYESYVGRALWSGYSKRTLESLVGAVFRKDPQVEFPDPLQGWLDDITGTGQTFTDFSRATYREAIAMNWGGILIDQPGQETPREERRPMPRLYQAEQIRNWRLEIISGQPQLTQLVLFEIDEEPAADGFGTEEIEQFRVLELEQASFQTNGQETTRRIYTQQLWRKQRTGDGKEEWLPFGEPIIPLRREQPLPFIPWEPINVDGPVFAIDESKLLALVDVNFDHFRLDADYKHGLHFTALPTAWIAGFPVDEGEYRIGSQTAWVTTNPQAQASFLEFSGAGLGAILAAKHEDEKMMAVLGARMLEEQKRAAEAAETVHLRQAGEESIIKTAARSVSSTLSNVLWVMAWWSGLDDPEVNVMLNTDIISAQISPQMLTALVQARQANAISEQTMLEAFVTGELIQGRTWQEEQELLTLTTLPTLSFADDDEAA